MSDAFADSNPTGLPQSKSAQSAADELRAAAEGRKVERSLTAAEEKAHALKEAAAKKAGQLRDFAGEKIEAIKDGAEETALQLKGAASEQWQDTRLKARELHTSIEDYVRKNPTKAVLTAVGAGFVIGLLTRR